MKGKVKMMTNLENVLTEKGNLKPAVAKAIKEQAREALATLGFQTMENGRLAKVLATADGKTITANVDLTIGCDTDFAKKAKAPKATVEIDNLME